MRSSDDLLLENIKRSHVYFDRYSLEKTTKKINPKYKLAGNIVLEDYLFLILTKNKATCKKSLTLTIHQEDWENKNPNHLNEKYTYCDITKFDILGKVEILFKIKDVKNKFPFIAKLCDKKYIKLLELRKKIRYQKYIPIKDINIINNILSDVIDEKKKELGI